MAFSLEACAIPASLNTAPVMRGKCYRPINELPANLLHLTSTPQAALPELTQIKGALIVRSRMSVGVKHV
jgi:hypothetical protein